MARKLAATAPAPSNHHARTKNGSGGRRPDQTTNANPLTGPYRDSDRLARFPTAHEAAEHRLSAKAASGIDAPLPLPMRMRPEAASAMPRHCARVGISRNTMAARTMVKNACDGWMTDERPEGIPRWMAQNSSANCARNVVPANAA